MTFLCDFCFYSVMEVTWNVGEYNTCDKKQAYLSKSKILIFKSTQKQLLQ